jgi:uncharacterized protein YjbJ (UPF0337 family)
MDKNRVKGTIDEVVGSAKRHVGSLTGDTKTEVKGAAQQIKGKVENAVGKLKDAGRDLHDHVVASNLADKEADRRKREAVLAKNHTVL